MKFGINNCLKACLKYTQEGGNCTKNFTKSETALRIFLKLSPCVKPQYLIKWQKNFGHSTPCTSDAPFMSKLSEELAPKIVEIFPPKIFWGGSRP